MPKQKNVNANYIIKRAKEIFQDIVDKHSLILWDVELTHIADDYTLTLLLDKDGGIDLLDLEEINPELNEAVDKADFIDFPYMFEVSSAGMLRTLKNSGHYEKALGHNVYVKFYKKNEEAGAKEVSGVLAGFDSEKAEITADEKKYSFLLADISQIKAEF